MDALSSVSPSMMLPPHKTTITVLSVPSTYWRRRTNNKFVVGVGVVRCCSNSDGGGGDGDGNERDGGGDEVDRALRLDGTIPGTSDEFVKQVSSRAYDIRRHLHQSIDSSSYDVLDANPWRGTSKPVYVLTQKENQLCTMKTRMNRSEVESELGLLFSKGRKRGSDFGNQPKQSRSGKKFQMVVEDVREGILVFEDQNEAARYCDLMEGGGQGCEGVAEIEASYASTQILMCSSFTLTLLYNCLTPP